MLARKPRDDRGVQEHAASLLVTQGALVALSQADALAVVGYMRPHRLSAGTVLMRQGEHGGDESMALILSGDVTVESVSATEELVVSVLGPGSLIGELGLVDQTARSATCTAASDLALAVLKREAFEQLMAEQPGVATRLLLAISQRVAGHLRETNRKLLTLARVNKALQQELGAAHAVNRRLLQQLDQAAPPAAEPRP
ncbi:Crp/Fnr family transcriptional regulator [Ottowia pentelensis]|uniref:Crp/Fnr family transcriptional regulator n=2 Tax=Ottowia pentelensis TaxID=511108 RepID=A0ABV6PNK0_9BURK